MARCTLVIGNRRYSSWSLRGWLALRQAGVAFTEEVIPLDRPDTKARILAWSPAGRVPVLVDDGNVVWDSLAICWHAALSHPEAALLPDTGGGRALCLSLCAEMHSGFAALRSEMPMDVVASRPGAVFSAECLADVDRIVQAWRDARARFGAGGPFLFGGFTIADAMFAPVCTRFATYGVDLDPVCRDYVDAVLALPAMREWYAAAAAEPWVIDI